MPSANVACCRQCGVHYELPGLPRCGHSQAPEPDSPLGQLIGSFKSRELQELQVEKDALQAELNAMKHAVADAVVRQTRAESEHDALAVRFREVEAERDELQEANRFFLQRAADADVLLREDRNKMRAAEADLTALRASGQALVEQLLQIERHCPCGARPESPHTHPHVGGCPVSEALALAAILSPPKDKE